MSDKTQSNSRPPPKTLAEVRFKGEAAFQKVTGISRCMAQIGGEWYPIQSFDKDDWVKILTGREC